MAAGESVDAVSYLQLMRELGKGVGRAPLPTPLVEILEGHQDSLAGLGK